MEACEAAEPLLQLACGGFEALPRALSENEISNRRHAAREVQQLNTGASNYEIPVRLPPLLF